MGSGAPPLWNPRPLNAGTKYFRTFGIMKHPEACEAITVHVGHVMWSVRATC